MMRISAQWVNPGVSMVNGNLLGVELTFQAVFGGTHFLIRFAKEGTLCFLKFKGNAYTSKGENPGKFCCLPCQLRSTLNGKNLFLWGKVFPLRVDPFQMGLGA